MDLLKLNNEISGMRPAARQSSVHVIHHLTRTAKGLKKKNGPDDKMAVYQKRAQRIMQEALIDKDLVPDEISKFALQFDASLRDKVLDDNSIPLSAKAFVRIAAHPIMAKAVNEFREKYPDWKTWLQNSLEKLGTGSRFGSKMKNGRVKAHLQQRQRVEEAVDTIRRAQMSWLHKEVKNKTKVKANEKEDTKEGKHVENDKAVEESNKAEINDNNAGKQERSQNQKIVKEDCESNGSSDDFGTNNSTPESLPRSISKPKIDSKKSSKADKHSSKSNKKLKPVVYEEVDENESSSESEPENHNEKKQIKALSKNKHSKKKVLVEKEDFSTEDDKSASESQIPFEDQCDSSAENVCEESGEESDFFKVSETDEKRAKKLSKKEKKKQKAIIPRSREVEVCKFSDLLKKEVTGKDDDDNSDESGDDRLESPEKGVDAFFMTRNHDLLRIATAKREAKPEEPVRTGPKWGIEGSETWTGTRQERRARARRMMGIPDPEGFSKRRGSPKFDAPSFPRQTGNRSESLPLPRANTPSVPDKPEELHPSWAAKRKMNIASVGFQGKKVKFDDSD